jgi:hypothetical protein
MDVDVDADGRMITVPRTRRMDLCMYVLWMYVCKTGASLFSCAGDVLVMFLLLHVLFSHRNALDGPGLCHFEICVALRSACRFEICVSLTGPGTNTLP